MFAAFLKRAMGDRRQHARRGIVLATAVVSVLVLAVFLVAPERDDSFSLTRPGTWLSGPHQPLADSDAADPDAPDPAADPASTRPGSAREPSAADAQAKMDPDDRASPTDPESDPRRQAAGEEDEPEPELAISGAVLDERGSLMPGVRVHAQSVGLPGRRAASAASAASQVTDSLGSFTFEPLAEGEYELAVDDSDEFHGTRMRVRAGVANAELRVQRIRSIRVHGQIVDENGMALARARVRALSERQTVPSDEEGAYEIIVEPVRAGQPPVIEFQHTGYRSRRERVDMAQVGDSDELLLDVALEPVDERVAVLGHVAGPRGEPVAGVEVWMSSPDPRDYQRTRTNEGGEFRFERVETGEAWRLGVNPGSDYRKYVSEAFAVGPDNTAHDVELEASGTGSLSGRLIDPEGRALGRFTLWLRSEDAGGHAPIPVSSDAGGNFEVAEVPAGRLRLETTSQPRLQAGGIELGSGETRHLEIPMDWGESWLFGQVVDAAGNPVPGARVTVQWQQQHYGVTSSSHRQAGTDLEGHFNFSNLGARDYSVTVQAPGFQTARRNLAPGMDEARIVIEPTSMAGGGR